MRRLVAINLKNGDGYFYLEQLEGDTVPDGFSCAIAEYDDYLLFIEDSGRRVLRCSWG